LTDTHPVSLHDALPILERLEAEIADLSEKAGAPDLWDDPESAQKVTSALSHRQSELARITAVERRLDDLEVLVELAREMDDADSDRKSTRLNSSHVKIS